MAKQTKQATPKDPVLEKALKRYKDSYDYQKRNWHDKWERDQKLYDNERYKASYEGTTDTFVPMPFSTIETMVSALNNADLRIDFKSGDPMKQVDVAPLNALIDEWWEDDQWDLSLEESYREVLGIGMDANMFSWEVDHPHLESFSIRDAIIDPTIKSPAQLQQEGHYAGRRYYVRKGTLDTYQVVDTDPDSKTYGELIDRFKSAPDSADPASEPDDKTTQEMFSGSTLSTAKEDQDEIIEIWDVNNVVTIKNRVSVIEDRVNPYKEKHEMLLAKQLTEQVDAKAQAGEYPDADAYEKAIKAATTRAKAEAKGIVPFFFLRNYRKKSLFYAKSEIDSIAKLVEYLNDMTNMEGDAIIKQLAAQRELDPEYEDWLDLIDDDPATVYPFKPGSLSNIVSAPLPANSFNNRMNIKNEIRETTAVDQVAKGASNVKDTTATEIRAQLSQTGARIESKARIFKKDGFYWMGWILMKMIQLYMDKPVVVEVPGAHVDPQETLERYGIELPKGTAIFDPADYQGDWKPRITLEVDAENKQVENRREARENYSIIVQDPTNNLAGAKEVLYPKMFNIDKEDLEKITTQPEPASAAGGLTPDAAGLPPELAALGGAAGTPVEGVVDV